jgi:hypothetical protein
MGIGDKNTELNMVLDIRTNLLRLVIDMGNATIRVSSTGNTRGAPSIVCRFKRGWCG